MESSNRVSGERSRKLQTHRSPATRLFSCAPVYFIIDDPCKTNTCGMEMTLPPTANRAVVALDPAPRRDVARLGALAEAVRAVEVLGLCVRLDLSARAG